MIGGLFGMALGGVVDFVGGIIGMLLSGVGGWFILAALVVFGGPYVAWAARSVFDRVAGLFHPGPRPVQTRAGQVRGVGAALAVMAVSAVGVLWVGGASASERAPLVVTANPAGGGPVVAPQAAPSLPAGLSGLVGTQAPTGAATAHTAPQGKAAAPVPVSALLHVFGGECLLPSNPQAPGTGTDQTVARMRLCFPAMRAASTDELNSLPGGMSRNLALLTLHPPLFGQGDLEPIGSALMAQLAPPDRAAVRAFDKGYAAWKRNDDALSKAMDLFYGANGGDDPRAPGFLGMTDRG